MPLPDLFPPRPRLRGREGELRTLVAATLAAAPTRLALVGAGGSGKSVLAAALGHRLAPRFGWRADWFRVGAWDYYTLLEILALRFGLRRGGPGERLVALRQLLDEEPRLLVLDNHEDDEAMARLLDALSGTRATFVITARRCLLAGVLVFPVTPPLATVGRAAFPRVAELTRPLRWSPLALDLADALVASGAITTAALGAWLERRGVGRVRVIEHEDDLPEVALLVEWAWARLPAAPRRMLAVLAHVEGDHVDGGSLAQLAEVATAGGAARRALDRLTRWHLVQEPARGRFAVHAVVRHALRRRTRFDPGRAAQHYLALLEAAPDRLVQEQSHLFAAMDLAHRRSDLAAMLRIGRLLERLA